ncbi:MAG TPA: hypothetical protein EYM78_02065 [Gemmatimonadetes bacterium]|nr:hypothetical protein [Gemmatimonadota bacterium]HIN49483.1 hypothetical protein [Gemmatimonadota bacterium]
MTEDPVSRLNTALSGRYTIEREIGVGGMATVYLARDERHDRNVALKVLRPELAVLMGSERFFRVTRPPERAPRRIIVIMNFFEELTRMVGEAN